MADKTKNKVKDQHVVLSAKKRDVFGKKLKKFRKGGNVPANISGPGFASTAIGIDTTGFSRLFRKTGATQVIYVAIDDSKDSLPVLVHHVQRHPIDGSILHIDFRKVDLLIKIEAQVPVKVIGESVAVTQKGGVLQTLSDSILVEALPDKIPSEIEIDITGMTEVNSQILVKDIKTTGDFVIKDDVEKVILQITEHKEEELTPQTEAPETEVTEQKEEDAESVEGTDEKTENKKTDEEPKENTDEKKSE